jgi:hypothetical protein
VADCDFILALTPLRKVAEPGTVVESENNLDTLNTAIMSLESKAGIFWIRGSQFPARLFDNGLIGQVGMALEREFGVAGERPAGL